MASNGMYGEDIIACRGEILANAEPLLTKVMERGGRTQSPLALDDIRRRFERQFSRLDPRYKSLQRHQAYPVRVSSKLSDLQP